jgi:hypothetical protein
VIGALFEFNREAIAAELSTATNDEYVLKLAFPPTEGRPGQERFVTVDARHPAIEDVSARLKLPFQRDEDIPVDVAIVAVENELKSHGCQVSRDDDPEAFEALARWTWPPLT